MHKKKENIEEFIKSNRGQLDDKNPPSNLWDNISKELDKDGSDKKSNDWIYYLKRAAAIIVIATTSVITYEYLRPTKASNDSVVTTEVSLDTTNARIPNEILEAEKFYSNQIDEKYDELKKYTVNYPDLNQDIEYDMAELDSAYKELKNDLKEEVANEEILEAMIQNHRLKLDVLEEMLLQLKSINKTDNNENQNKEI